MSCELINNPIAPSIDELNDSDNSVERPGKWYQMSFFSTLVVATTGLVFLLGFANKPLWHSDLWDHVNYGAVILNDGFPSTEPLIEAASDVPLVPMAWASQVAMASMHLTPAIGLPGIQFANGFLAIAALLAIGLAVFNETRSSVFGMLSGAIFLSVNWQQFLVVRPQLAGVTCYSILAAVLLTGRMNKAMFLWVPAMFVFWVNAHGSFAIGLALMAFHGAGGLVDSFVAKRRNVDEHFDETVQAPVFDAYRHLLLLVFCTAACLVNPYGIQIFLEVIRVSDNPNVSTMYEWAPLTLSMKQGKAMVIASFLALAAILFGGRRIRCRELIPLVATAVLTIWSSRMINWFAPLVAFCFGVHGASLFRSRFARNKLNRQGRGSIVWALLNVVLCAVTFASSNFGVQTIRGKTFPSEEVLSSATPVQVARFIGETDELPNGLVFMPAEWAGYVTNQVPRVSALVNIHVHLMPVDVWNDYIDLTNGAENWAQILDEYQINALVLDRFRQRRLESFLQNNQLFHVIYTDWQSRVFVRSAVVESETGKVD